MERTSHFAVGLIVGIILFELRALFHQWIGDTTGIVDPYLQTGIVIAIIVGIALGVHVGFRQVI